MIGHWLVSPSVHDTLGIAPTALPGDMWLLLVEDSIALGFAQLRIQVNNLIHLRLCYSSNKSNQTKLIREVIDYAKEINASGVYTNDRETQTVYKELNFVKQKSAKRGEFVRWERQLQ
jgi:hypothetical protein